MNKIKELIKDSKGIILEGVIAISFIFFSSLIWLIGEIVIHRTYDAMVPTFFDQIDPRGLALVDNYINAYAVSIIIVDALLLLWWGLSTQKHETQEYPGVTF